MKRAHAFSECAASKTELVVCGGCRATDCHSKIWEVEVYNPETDKYVNLPPPGFKLTDLNYNNSTFHSFQPDSTNSPFTDTEHLEVQN